MEDNNNLTPDATNEGGSVNSADPVDTETHAEVSSRDDGDSSVSEETSETETASTDSDDFGVDYDLTDVPDIIKPRIEAKIKDIEKGFKSAYTKKTMAMSDEKAKLSAKLSEQEQSLNSYKTIAQQVLANPEAYELARKHYGFVESNNAKPVPEALPELQTVGDLTKYIDAQVEKRSAEKAQQLRNTLYQETVKTKAVSQWESALNSMRNKHDNFTNVEKVVNSWAQDEKYKSMFNGANHEEVLEIVYSDIKASFEPIITTAAKKRADELVSKTKSGTLQPNTKTVKVKSGEGRSISLAEALNRVQDKLAAKGL